MAVIHRTWLSWLRVNATDYLAGVLCLVFVDEVHQKEPERHVQTFKGSKQTLTV